MKNPLLKDAAQKGIRRIMRGQNLSGGFDYNVKKSDRNDTSYMSWCAQALKAAKMSEIFDSEEAEELNNVIKKSIDGFRKNYKDGKEYMGGFGYVSPDNSGLTSAGTLSMQLLSDVGIRGIKEVSGGLRSMDNWKFEWNGGDNGSIIYYAYYSTQAKFHEGGDVWKKWNDQFSISLINNQTRIPKSIEDSKKRMVDTGYWDSSSSGHSDSGEGKRVMTTCLCTLMLEVYYRYLPTFDIEKIVDEKNVINSDKKLKLVIEI